MRGCTESPEGCTTRTPKCGDCLPLGTDPGTDWGPLAAAAFAHVRALQHRPAVDPQTDLDHYRAAEQRTRAREWDDDAAEVIAEDIRHEQAARVARYHERREP